MVLFSTTSHAVASTIQQEIQEQEKRDIKASGSRLGEKIAVGIGICILCYIFYSWRGDTWGLKKYRDTHIVKHGASVDFVKKSGSWMYRAMPKNERYRGMDMSGIGVPDGTSDERAVRSESLLNMTGGKGTRGAFKHDFRNLDRGNYPGIDDDNATLSGNEVFMDEPILQQEKAKKYKPRRSSILPMNKTDNNSIMRKAKKQLRNG